MFTFSMPLSFSIARKSTKYSSSKAFVGKIKIIIENSLSKSTAQFLITKDLPNEVGPEKLKQSLFNISL